VCLLVREVDIEARDQDGKTALIASAEKGHKFEVKCLLCQLKWAGVTAEVRHLVNIICLMIKEAADTFTTRSTTRFTTRFTMQSGGRTRSTRKSRGSATQST
jgi:hypothetical protein